MAHKMQDVRKRFIVNDLINIICASIEKPMPGRIYNACDDEPASSAEVIEYAAKLLGVKPPPLVPIEEAKLSQMARSFYSESKRVKNTRIKDELGVSLLYPKGKSRTGPQSSDNLKAIYCVFYQRDWFVACRSVP